jgi:tetratricopeptide (TPR) repeat protein
VALREHVLPVLERDPDNAEALELKRQIEQTPARPKPAPAPAAPVEREIDGVTRRPNEPYDEYQARAKKLSAAIIEGKNALDKQDYATAVARFHAVDRDQPRYMGVDVLLSDALEKQRSALQDALNSAQLNEQAGRLKTARQWYQRAEFIDPTSTAAKEKEGFLLASMKSQADKLFNQATLASKTQDTQLAIRLYQQILDLMNPGDEFYEKAKRAKDSEAVKK